MRLVHSANRLLRRQDFRRQSITFARRARIEPGARVDGSLADRWRVDCARAWKTSGDEIAIMLRCPNVSTSAHHFHDAAV